MTSVPAVPAGLAPGGRLASWDPAPPAFVALDVDGTLVREEPVPSERVRDAVAALTSQGVDVGLATGRMGASTDRIVATGVFTGPHVFHNGAVVTDASGTDRVVLGLEDDEVDALLALGRTRDDLSVEIYVGRTYLSDRDDPRSAAHAELLGVAPSGRIASAADLDGRAAVKAVLVCFTLEAAVETTASVSAMGLAAGPAGSPATPRLRFVNVTRAGVDKGSGIMAAAGLIATAPQAVVAVGDETNDIPALMRSGTAIAMGGSAPEVIAAAHLVAPSFGEEGAAVALEALVGLVRP